MTGTTEGLPMDVAKDAQWQQQQQQQQQEGKHHHKKELDRNESVRARLLGLSQVDVEAGGEVESLDTPKESPKESPPPAENPASDNEDEFRRKLMSISYVDVPMSAQ